MNPRHAAALACGLVLDAAATLGTPRMRLKQMFLPILVVSVLLLSAESPSPQPSPVPSSLPAAKRQTERRSGNAEERCLIVIDSHPVRLSVHDDGVRGAHDGIR